MVRQLLSVAVIAGALTLPFASGCNNNEEVSEEKTVRVRDDGTVIRKTERVTENADGSVTKTEKREVDKPGDND